jgi:hypothetical protein
MTLRPRIRVPFTGTEKESLQASLDRQRDVVPWKLEGLDDEQLRRPMTPSGTNLLGLVKHLGYVEFGWFCQTFGRDYEPGPEDDLRVSPDESTADIVALYRRACAAADAAIAELPLDARAMAWFGEEVSMRWVLLHMIEETSRHAGHLDILRELLDGATGAYPLV